MKTNWKEFCERIISTNGNPSTKDAEECGISFSAWFELATRKTSEQLVKNAKEVLKRIEVK